MTNLIVFSFLIPYYSYSPNDGLVLGVKTLMRFFEGGICSEELLSTLSPWGKQWVIITDDVVKGLFGNALELFLRAHTFKVHLLAFPPGEISKCRAVKASLEDQMFQFGCNKDWGLIALGGGVVTDIAGYIAATFCRGIPLINIPTTLLGMVDASLGGKNGINLPWGKNLLGTLYQPKEVIIDQALLDKLPHLHGGLEETIKHALIADPILFEFIEANKDAIISREQRVLRILLEKSCYVKERILREDMDDTNGKRNLLNFGHTVGHAIESLSNYTINHGEAIGLGMRMESQMAVEMGKLPLQTFERIQNLFDMYDLFLDMPKSFSAETLWSHMCRDKKTVQGRIRIVILEGIGQATCSFLDQEIWEDTYGQVMCKS